MIEMNELSSFVEVSAEDAERVDILLEFISIRIEIANQYYFGDSITSSVRPPFAVSNLATFPHLCKLMAFLVRFWSEFGGLTN